MSISIQYVGLVLYRGYEVGDDGSVWSYWEPDGHTSKLVAIPHRLTPTPIKGTGYLRLIMRNRKTVKLHTLILLGFAGYPPPGHEACHKQNNKLNCRADNLYWGTKLENAADMKRHGTMCRGTAVASAKLVDADVRQIRQRLAQGESRKSLAKEYRVARSVIQRIDRNEGWTHV